MDTSHSSGVTPPFQSNSHFGSFQKDSIRPTKTSINAGNGRKTLPTLHRSALFSPNGRLPVESQNGIALSHPDNTSPSNYSNSFMPSFAPFTSEPQNPLEQPTLMDLLEKLVTALNQLRFYSFGKHGDHPPPLHLNDASLQKSPSTQS